MIDLLVLPGLAAVGVVFGGDESDMGVSSHNAAKTPKIPGDGPDVFHVPDALGLIDARGGDGDDLVVMVIGDTAFGGETDGTTGTWVDPDHTLGMRGSETEQDMFVV